MSVTAVEAEPRPQYLSTMVWCLIATYLFIDILSGALLEGVGGTTPMSQAWKTLTASMILLWIAIVTPRTTLFMLALLLFVLSGPLIRLLSSGDGAAFETDMLAGAKIVIPSVVFAFCYAQRIFEPTVFARWLPRALWLGAAAIFVNMCLGLLGFGYTSYGRAETGGIGITGFFYAGNELAAAFLVACGYVLMKLWNGKRWLYAPAALIAIAMALAMATKTAMAGAVLLTVALPVVYRRGRGLRLRWSSALTVLVALGALTWAAFQIAFLLELSGAGGRIARLFAEGGWLAVIFTGRDYYAAAGVDALTAQGSLVDVFFGVGQQTLEHWVGKAAMEADLLDLYLWLGVPGLMYGVLLFTVFLQVSFHAYLDRGNAAGPGVLLTNLLLIGASVLSGHVITSGIVGIVWAAFNATVWLPSHLNAFGQAGAAPTGAGPAR